MEDPRTVNCILCKSTEIDLLRESHRIFKGKPICVNCVESLLYGNTLKKPVQSTMIECRIPAALDINLYYSELCNFHQKKYKLYCALCRSGLCWKCATNHKGHLIQDLKEVSDNYLKQLYQLEYCLAFVRLAVADKMGEALALSSQVSEYYFSLNNASYLENIANSPALISEVFAKAASLNPDFIGLSLSEVKESIDTGRGTLKAFIRKELMHWCEWNSNIIHFTDILTSTKITYQLSFKVPFYCRSIQLPNQEFLLCGGREDKNSNGLKGTWIVYLREQLRTEKIDDMTIGRSNHFLLYFKNSAYAIGGCDHKNVFTNKCERLNLQTLKWKKISSTNEVRDTTAGVGIPEHDAIYVFGGRIDNKYLSDTIEKYSITNDMWTTVPLKLNYPTSAQGVCIVPGTTAQVLVFAGQDTAGKDLNGVNLINLEKGKVETKQSIALGGGCIVNEVQQLNGKIYTYVFKGYNIRALVLWNSFTQDWEMISQS